MKRLSKAIATVGVCIALSMAASAQAGVIIGTADTGNCYPFLCNDSGTDVGQSIEYQQVYTSTAFSGPISITQLTFYQIFAAQFGGSTTVLDGNYQISLSTTSAPVNGLSTNLASNIGADNTLFFNGNLGGMSVNPSLNITGGPFNYDPSKGNLLVDIFVTNQANVPNGSGNGYNDADSTGSVTSRAYFLAGSTQFGNADSVGLVTGFNVASIPEPSGFVLAGTALIAGLGVSLRRRRARA
jgi:hypothetical protein